ncbi:MAG: hypothetical protein EOM37_01970 [Proteobacteria bacterium]|jgi:hypothetical protein|nr:hypothetical protein [Alphaproteobacteria bacterium]NCC02802.1 hypothetical protein [Pseudomonadota bacterium]
MSSQADQEQEKSTPAALVNGFLAYASPAKAQLKGFTETLCRLNSPVRPPFYIRYTGLAGLWSEKRSQETNRVSQERDSILTAYHREVITVITALLPDDPAVKKAVQSLSAGQAMLEVLVYNKESLHNTALQFLCLSKLLQRVIKDGSPLNGRTDIACAAMSLNRSLVESAKLEESLIEHWPKGTGKKSIRPDRGALALVGDAEATTLVENLTKMQRANADVDSLSAELKQSGEGIKRVLKSARHNVQQAQDKHAETIICDLEDFYAAVANGVGKIKDVDRKTMRAFLFAVKYGALSKKDVHETSPYDLFISCSLKDGAAGPVGILERAYNVEPSPIVAEETLSSDLRKRLNFMRQRPLIRPLYPQEQTTRQTACMGKIKQQVLKPA